MTQNIQDIKSYIKNSELPISFIKTQSFDVTYMQQWTSLFQIIFGTCSTLIQYLNKCCLNVIWIQRKICIKIYEYYFNKKYLKMSSAKCQQFCLGLHAFNIQPVLHKDLWPLPNRPDLDWNPVTLVGSILDQLRKPFIGVIWVQWHMGIGLI